ncbi:MAG TPA: LysM peptidoglycan-binding domain-containing protein [Thermodesulfobacteriota bacterium]|nr:LysM peptidoglycan-binding domain-containing protein [Thermodesulfobacteriota bacterium]
MLGKTLVAGIIVLLLCACHPHPSPVSEKTSPAPLPPKECASLPTQTGSEKSSSQEIPSAPSPTSPAENLGNWSLEFPSGEESNDDFSLEVIPKDRQKQGPDFDIPIVINAKVEQFIQYFQTTARKVFTNWLARSERYIPFMKSLLRENGLPEDLVYMALIESGFNPYAYSRSKASGPWQFIYLTGKKYGLRSDWWIDERRDPEKSTVAAAKYLKDLHDMFECWYLAAAGYNAGEKKIAAAMKRYGTEDFWELTKYRYLKRETKDYVPQMIAAALIAKEPEKYGFIGIEYQEPLRYDKVKVPEVTDLRLIAKACEVGLDDIKDLNPELSRWCTPPSYPDYEIKIPFGKKELFLKNFEAISPGERLQFRIHSVKKGETPARIAKLYGVDLEPILELNRLSRKSRLSKGMDLLIPLPKDHDQRLTAMVKKESNEGNRHSKPKKMTYTIKKGDTLWSIANDMGVNVGALSSWNNLYPDKKLVPGDKLEIRITKAPAALEESHGKRPGKEITYVVQEGDTLWTIAKKFNLTVSEIKTWNHLDGSICIHPEDRLKLKVGSTKPQL